MQVRSAIGSQWLVIIGAALIVAALIVAPGIVVGRLQYERLLGYDHGYDHGYDLKVRYAWMEDDSTR